MLRILFLTPRFPWPLIGGDRVKSYHLLRHLAKHHQVTLVAFNHGGRASQEQIDHIESLGVEVFDLPLQPLAAGAASLRTVVTPLPLEIAFYTRPDYRRAVEHLLATRDYDLGISFFMRTAEYIRYRRELPKILIAEDCRVEYQSRSTSASKSPLQKLVRWWETRKLLRYEPQIVEDFDVTTFVSNEDIASMKRLNRSPRYELVTNGVDLDYFHDTGAHHERHGMLFSGKLDVQANHLMATTIIRDVLPKVRERIPDATLTIAGAHPRPALRALIGDGIDLHADVPHMLPYFQRAAVFIHPHHGGSGIQNKVLEAMASGCPVVTTPTGLQGIDAVHGVHAMVGTTPGELAEHVVTLLRDQSLRIQMAAAARYLMEVTHSWDHVFEQIDATIASCVPHSFSTATGSSTPVSSTVT
jgi:sugar transferase (PEP-CTERM/EpsH1 system associated)